MKNTQINSIENLNTLKNSEYTLDFLEINLNSELEMNFVDLKNTQENYYVKTNEKDAKKKSEKSSLSEISDNCEIINKILPNEISNFEYIEKFNDNNYIEEKINYYLSTLKNLEEIKISLKKITESNKENKNNDYNININKDKDIDINKLKYEFNYIQQKQFEDLRKDYNTKLISNKILEFQNKKKDQNSLIIFDWDDTLLPTTFLNSMEIKGEDLNLGNKEIKLLQKLSDLIFKILIKAIEKADVYIITNASPNWIEFSLRKYYPELEEVIKKVNIISARGEYEKLFPGNSLQWKINAFLDIIKKFDTSLVTNLICIGDSNKEIEAGKVLASKFNKVFFKTIKFKESPEPEELYKQLMILDNKFDYIFRSIENLTITVGKKQRK